MVLLLAAVASACVGGGTSDDGKVPVVAGFYPLAEAATRVGGDRVAVRNLTPAGAEPHDLELRSTDIDRIETASVVLYLGRGFQPAVEEAARRGRGEAVDLLAGDTGLRGDDPHVWLDPTRMADIAERVRAALVRADPSGQAIYDANAAAYSAELLALDAEFLGGLSTCTRRTIVTSHAAFGYLAARYGLTQEAASGLDPESEPDPRRLSELAAKVRADGVTTVFSETLVSPEVAETLARESGARTAVLNPIEGLNEDEEAAGKDYAALMRENLGTLREALGCG